MPGCKIKISGPSAQTRFFTEFITQMDCVHKVSIQTINRKDAQAIIEMEDLEDWRWSP